MEPITLALPIARRAHELEGRRLDDFAREIQFENWMALTLSLDFFEEDTGGGFGCLSAELPDGYTLMITDGEAGLPSHIDKFYLSISDAYATEMIVIESL